MLADEKRGKFCEGKEAQRGETPLNVTENPATIPPSASQKGSGLSVASLTLGILTALPGPVLAIAATIYGGGATL